MPIPRTTEWKPWKRGSLWSARRRHNGLRESQPTGKKTKKEALAVIARWNREADDPVHAAANSTTFGTAVNTFIDENEGRDLAPPTKEIHACKAGHLVRIIGAGTVMSSITAKTIDTYTADRLTERASRATIAKELGTLRGVLGSARRRGEFARDPAAVLPRQWRTGSTPRTRWLPYEEADRLLAALPEHHACRIAYALGTGGRDGEIERAVPHEDVDWTAGQVRIRGTKTRAANRVIPITRLMRPYLERALRGVAPGTGFRPWSNRIRDLAAACKRVGIKRAGMNDLRRTFASWHLHAGVSPHVVARMLGHTSTTMLERVYGQQTAATLRKLIEDQLRVPRPTDEPEPTNAAGTAPTHAPVATAVAEPTVAPVIPISSARRNSGR